MDFDYNNDNGDEDTNIILEKDLETIQVDRALTNRNSRTPSRNLVSHLHGPKDLKDEAEIFQLFIPDDTLDLIVTHTNEEIKRLASKFTSKQWYISETDIIWIIANVESSKKFWIDYE